MARGPQDRTPAPGRTEAPPHLTLPGAPGGRQERGGVVAQAGPRLQAARGSLRGGSRSQTEICGNLVAGLFGTVPGARRPGLSGRAGDPQLLLGWGALGERPASSSQGEKERAGSSLLKSVP